VIYEHFRNELVASVQELFNRGLITSSGGNISVRLPDGEGYLVTPSGLDKGSLTPDQLIIVDGAGNPKGALKKGLKPSIETLMHIGVYEARPTMNAVIHTHAPFCTILGICGLRILPVTIETTQFIDTPIVPFYPPGSCELAEAVAACAKESNAVLLQNHGLLTIGKDLLEASKVALALEDSAKTSMLCSLLSPKPAVLPEHAIQFVREYFADKE